MFASDFGSPCTLARTTNGLVAPPGNSSRSATYASRLSRPAGRTEASGTAWLRRRKGEPAASRRTSVGMRTRIGWRMTHRATLSQRLLRGRSAARGGLPRRTRSISKPPLTLSALTRGPSIPSTAGRKVRPKKTEHSTTIDPAMPIDEIAGETKKRRPSSPIATAMPEKVTALPAVPTAIWTASPTSLPRRSSSRKRLTRKSE